MQRGRSLTRPRQPRRSSRIPLTQVKAGEVYNGVVTWASPTRGVYVDFGAERDGLLRVRPQYARAYSKGMQVRGMLIRSCYPETGKVFLQPDPDTLPEPVRSSSPSEASQSARSRSQSAAPRSRSAASRAPSAAPRSQNDARWRGRSQSAATAYSSSSRRRRRSRSQSRPRRDWEHPEGLPLSEVQVGNLVDGVVTGANRFGVFVDFGSVKDGRVLIPRQYVWDFKVGDQLRDVMVHSVDVQAQRVVLRIFDLEATLDHLHRERVPLEDLQEGMIVDGIICNAGPFGVFVNIGATKDGKLKVPRRVQYMMLSGEQVQGMRIERIDLELQRLTLVFDDPLIESTGGGAADGGASQPGGGAATGNGGGGAQRSPTRSPSPPEEAVIPLEEIRVGELADGIVVNITNRGVMVDIGAMALGTLALPAELRQRFQVNDMVEGMVVEEVDLKRQQVILSMDDPELAVVDGRPFEEKAADQSATRASPATEPAAKPKAKARTKVKAKAH